MAVDYKPGEYGRGFDDNTLLPCPFCGAKAFSAPSGSTGAVIKCGECSARTVSVYGPADAARDWNRRTHRLTSHNKKNPPPWLMSQKGGI